MIAQDMVNVILRTGPASVPSGGKASLARFAAAPTIVPTTAFALKGFANALLDFLERIAVKGHVQINAPSMVCATVRPASVPASKAGLWESIAIVQLGLVPLIAIIEENALMGFVVAIVVGQVKCVKAKHVLSAACLEHAVTASASVTKVTVVQAARTSFVPTIAAVMVLVISLLAYALAMGVGPSRIATHWLVSTAARTASA